MKIKQFSFFVVVSILFSLTGYAEPLPYKESRTGNYLYLNPFRHKPASSAEHWEYATSLRDQGKTSAAIKQYEILLKRWPDSPQSAAAKQAVGDLYFKEGKNKEAFDAYEELIQSYYTGLKNYDMILENQYAIAQREMTRRRMKFLFGGYTAPERAVPYLESIIRNAPQWERAPEMQFQIGEAYRRNGDLELAVEAYTTVEYRYPDSPFAEKAAWAKMESLKKLVEKTPYSVDMRERAQLAVQLFVANYPDSDKVIEADHFADELAERAAQHDFEVGGFYERVPFPDQVESSRIYYEKVISEHAETDYASSATERLRVLFPVHEEGQVVMVSTNGAAGVEHMERGPLPERLVEDEDAIEVTADRMEYEGDMLIGEGNVALQQEGASLQADHVSVNPETGDITATGNIVMLREGNRWTGEDLLYNFKTKEGTFGESDMYFEPVYITAEKTERVGTNEFLMTNARITTCSGDKPLVYAKAREVSIIDENKPSGRFIKAKDVTFYVGKVPVFYTPIWERHLGYRIFTFSVGYGGRLGVFIMGRAELHPTDWLTTNTHLDLYSSRGLGLGQDFKWTTESGKGHFKTYYINDGDPYDSDDNVGDMALIDSNRYRVRLDHREQLNETTYFQTEFNYLSDPDVLDDFFNDEFRQEANPENYAVVQHATDDYAASLRVDKRLNDFYTSVNRMPELSADLYRSQIGESPFYFQSDNSLGFFEMVNSETNSLNDYSATRFDTYNQLLLPMRVKEFFNIIPRAAYRGTWYSGTPGGSAEYRSVFELGTLAAFKARKVLTEKSGFYGTGLRHILEPYADYSYRYASGVETNDLYQFDEIDTFGDRNEVRFGLRNFIQTKRGAKRIVNFLDADLYTAYRLDPLDDGNEFGPVDADLQMLLTDHFRIQSDLEYDMYDASFNRYNARLKYQTDDLSEYAFEYRYLSDTRSLYAASVDLFPNDDWSYQFLARYDTTFGEWRDRRVMVNHKFDCVGMGVGFKMDEDDELTLWFQLWLTAFGRPDADRIL